MRRHPVWMGVIIPVVSIGIEFARVFGTEDFMRVASPLFVAIFVLAVPLSSFANRSSHERINVKEIKSGGQVVGMEVEMLLKPYGSGHKFVRIGIGNGATVSKPNAQIKGSSALVEQKEIQLKQPGSPEMQSIKVMYGDKFKPGSQFTVVTAWHTSNTTDTGWHVWGSDGLSSPLTAPGAAAKRVASVKMIKRSGQQNRPLRAARTRTRAKQKPAAKHQRARARGR